MNLRNLQSKPPAPAAEPRSSSDASLLPEQRVLAECLRLVGRQLRRATAVATPMALFLAAGLRSVTDNSMLLLWVGLIVAASALLVFVSGFEPTLDTALAIENRRNEVVTVIGLLAAAWGSAPLLLFASKAHGTERLLLAVSVFGAMSSIALGTLLLRAAFLATVLPIALPMVLRLLLTREEPMMAAAAVGASVTVGLLIHGFGASKDAVTLIRNRVENGLLGQRVEKLRKLVTANEEELNRVYDEMGEQQQRDELTGAFNRKQFTERLVLAWQNAANGYDPFTCAFVEIGNFDKIVATHGSEVGNEALRAVAKILDDTLRTDDSLARLNGPQFAMLLNNALTDGAMIALERIRRKLVSSNLNLSGTQVLLNVSIGLATFEPNAGVRELLVRVDQALSNARDGGVNRIVVWEQLNARGSVLDASMV